MNGDTNEGEKKKLNHFVSHTQISSPHSNDAILNDVIMMIIRETSSHSVVMEDKVKYMRCGRYYIHQQKVILKSHYT